MKTRQFAEFSAAVIHALPSDMSPEQAQKWINNQGALARTLRLALNGERSEFPVVVDYDKSLDDMIQAGNYDWVCEKITAENFPYDCEGKHGVRLEYHRFDRVVTGEEAFELLDMAGFRPATLPELLAFGAAFPEEQEKHEIVTLSSVATLCLYSELSERRLGLDELKNFNRPSHRRFLVVRKSGWEIFRDHPTAPLSQE